MPTETLPVSELEPRLSELIERLRAGAERFVITREGKAEAVLLGAEEFEGLLETLDILSDGDLVRRLVEAEDELAAGGGRSLEDVRGELRRAHGPALEPR
ncbi:MAG: type II toxin-antitoxin system Phd/YefM family antitoxin [Thermoanaerobaculia bacterium]